MFVKTVRRSSLNTLLVLIACSGAALMLLTWPQAAASGIRRGLSLCSSIIIPSLFPFLVLAGFLIKSGLSAAIGRRLERPTRFLFGLPGCCAAGILIGMIGGYPAGGIAVGELVRQEAITPAQGRRMLGFCVNGGPAFIISAVGAAMLGSVTYGFLLYGAHIAASLLLGVLLRGEASSEERRPPERRLSAAPAFVESVNGACRSMLSMCGFIVLFASVLSLADGSGFSSLIETRLAEWFGAAAPVGSCLLPCLLEVSCGSVEAAHAGAAAPLILGLALGWGGLSVHCQIAATLQDLHLISGRFFAARLLHAVLGGLFTAAAFRLVPVAATAFGSFSEKVILPYSSSASASASLLCLCALFLLTLSERADEQPSRDAGVRDRGRAGPSQ